MKHLFTKVVHLIRHHYLKLFVATNLFVTQDVLAQIDITLPGGGQPTTNPTADLQRSAKFYINLAITLVFAMIFIVVLWQLMSSYKESVEKKNFAIFGNALLVGIVLVVVAGVIGIIGINHVTNNL